MYGKTERLKTMTRSLWLNLPVKDLAKSKEFFTKLGFSFNKGHGSTEFSECLLIGEKNTVVMLFTETVFQGFTKHEITDASLTTEVLISIDAGSKEEVDELAKKAAEAGGTVFSAPGGNDFMYGCGFADLDAHRWNVLFMDMSKIQNG